VSERIIVERRTTAQLSPSELDQLRTLLWSAFDDDFGEDDWVHALGGTHVIAREADRSVAHAAVVPRTLWIDDRALAAGYVEGVATERLSQGRGLGTAVMRELGAVIEAGFEIGALSTGRPDFYERLGWLRWTGSTFVRSPDGHELPTPDDDHGILVLPTSRSGSLPLSARITADWRAGDVW
jgi:aminoglycoside 2'-N-acetyltransferase I